MGAADRVRRNFNSRDEKVHPAGSYFFYHGEGSFVPGALADKNRKALDRISL